MTDEDDDSPTLLGAIKQALERQVKTMFGPMPGKVTAYNATTQRVSVQPLIRRTDYGEGGERTVNGLPIVENVPVMFPGAGANRLTFPIAVGDTMLLVFADSSLDKWLARGGEVDPEDDRHFDITDAVAFPSIERDPPTTAPTDAVVLHAELLRLGTPTAADPVARKSDLDAVISKLNELISTFSGHTHLYSPGAGAAIVTAGPSSLETAMSSQACSAFVKVP